MQLILLYTSIGFLGKWKKLLRKTSAFCAHIFYSAILRISYVDKKSRKFPFFRAKVRNFRETKNAKIPHKYLYVQWNTSYRKNNVFSKACFKIVRSVIFLSFRNTVRSFMIVPSILNQMFKIFFSFFHLSERCKSFVQQHRSQKQCPYLAAIIWLMPISSSNNMVNAHI